MAEIIADDVTALEAEVVRVAAACPTCNLVVMQDGVPLEQEFVTVRVLAIEHLCPSVIELTVETPFTGFVPGQHVTFALSDRKGQFWRAYSIVACDGGRLSFCIKLDSRGRAGRVLARLRVGGRLRISPPKGEFALLAARETGTDCLRAFVATGTGIAPILPMLRSIPDVPKKVLFGARHEHELLYAEQLAAVPNTELHITVSRPESSWEGLKGRVTEHLGALNLSPGDEIYLCGHPDMVAEVTTTLAAQGHAPGTIVAECFAKTVGGEAPAISIWQSLALLARRVHLYTSIPLVMLLLFYAVTGFLGNRADLFANQTEADGSEVAADHQYTLPPDLPLKVAAVGPWLEKHHGGQIDPDVAEEDDESILCDAESVWGTHTFTIDKPSRTYQVESRRAPWIVALVNLHRGKHAGWRQKLLVDLSAAVLALVCITGIAMVACARTQVRQRIVMAVLGTLSILLLVFFLMNR